MDKPITVISKRRGRPATGRDPILTARLPQVMIDGIEKWAKHNDCTRSEALRRLVELALPVSAQTPLKKPAGKHAGSASKMITAAGLGRMSKEIIGDGRRGIDRLGDETATYDERARRKRRLIKGPTEFREMRGNKPKA